MSLIQATKPGRYSKQKLWSLFLTCAFPFHLWTLIQVFRDVSWVTERTNAWDAVGVASYGMLFALVESLLAFLVVVLLGLVTPRYWDDDRRIAFLSLLFLITAVWGMISQLLFIWNIQLPSQTMEFLVRSGHPLRWLYGGSLAIVLATVLLPVYLFFGSSKFSLLVQDFTDRLSVLTIFYLLFDLAGLTIVIVRNL
jgi:hypothetical protein